MGFFQDLKEDLSLAVNELLPEDDDVKIADNANETEEDESVDHAMQQVEAALSAEFVEKDDNSVSETEEMKEADNDEKDSKIEADSEETTNEEQEMKELLDSESEDNEVETTEAQDDSQHLPKEEKTKEVESEKEVETAVDTEVQEVETEKEAETNKEDVVIEETDKMVTEKSVEKETNGSKDPLMEAAAAQIASIAHIVSKDEPKVNRANEITEDDISDEDFEERRLQTPEELLREIDSKEDETELEKEVNKAMADQKLNLTDADVVDETAVITAGMGITGDITSKGSLEVLGKVKGNIEILGKLNVSGNIEGDSKAAEVFADSAHVTGMIKADGTVKIGQNSVIIGNISASSAVIAGAVKGDIDVMGPVILDASAVVMGNIKSKSVQINNGAVIEGMCSQCYAEVNPTSFFEQLISK